MSEPSPQGRVQTDEERARALLEQLKSVHAFDLAYETIVGLLNFGSQKMGLSDETRAVRDLGDARLAIELIRAVLEVIEREQVDDRTHGLRDALAQMQLGYAHAVQLASAERAAAAEKPVEPTAEGPEAPEEPQTTKGPEAAREASTAERGDVAAAPHEPAAKKKPEFARKVTAKKKPAAARKTTAKKKPAGKKPAAGG
jgi:hypothetical protein